MNPASQILTYDDLHTLTRNIIQFVKRLKAEGAPAAPLEDTKIECGSVLEGENVGNSIDADELSEEGNPT